MGINSLLLRVDSFSPFHGKKETILISQESESTTPWLKLPYRMLFLTAKEEPFIYPHLSLRIAIFMLGKTHFRSYPKRWCLAVMGTSSVKPACRGLLKLRSVRAKQAYPALVSARTASSWQRCNVHSTLTCSPSGSKRFRLGVL